MFACAFPTVIPSIFGKSFPFPFPYFVLFVLRYFPFHMVNNQKKIYMPELEPESRSLALLVRTISTALNMHVKDLDQNLSLVCYPFCLQVVYMTMQKISTELLT